MGKEPSVFDLFFRVQTLLNLYDHFRCDNADARVWRDSGLLTRKDVSDALVIAMQDLAAALVKESDT